MAGLHDMVKDGLTLLSPSCPPRTPFRFRARVIADHPPRPNAGFPVAEGVSLWNGVSGWPECPGSKT